MEHRILKTDFSVPCTRVINGHRLTPVPVIKGDFVIGLFWTTRPNYSAVEFCFTSLKSAEYFCTKYKNKHNCRFWQDFYLKNPIYKRESAINSCNLLDCFV